MESLETFEIFPLTLTVAESVTERFQNPIFTLQPAIHTLLTSTHYALLFITHYLQMQLYMVINSTLPCGEGGRLYERSSRGKKQDSIGF